MSFFFRLWFQFEKVLNRFPIWVSPIVWFLFISTLSQIPGASGESTGRVFHGDWNLLFRSAAHLFVFFVQGMFWLSALHRHYQDRKTQKQIMIQAILLTAFCGILDELHQGIVPNRSCRLQDMIKDSIAGVIAAWFWVQAKRSTQRSDWPRHSLH